MAQGSPLQEHDSKNILEGTCFRKHGPENMVQEMCFKEHTSGNMPLQRTASATMLHGNVSGAAGVAQHLTHHRQNAQRMKGFYLMVPVRRYTGISWYPPRKFRRRKLAQVSVRRNTNIYIYIYKFYEYSFKPRSNTP